jgi:hypothetical protein
MIINKKMLERFVRKDKYLFSYHNTSAGFSSLLSPAHKTMGVRYETIRYI